MINRWMSLAACLLLGAGFGWWLAGKNGLGVGLLVVGVAWLLLDTLRMARLLKWLRAEQSADVPGASAGAAPMLGGVWGQLADRIRRLLKNRERQFQDSQSRLNEILSAMQASPNGVVLLDGEGRIEWCNQTAAQHFGFDAQRDVMQHIANLVRAPGFTAYLTGNDFSGDVTIPGGGSTPARPVKLSVHLHAYGNDRKLLLSRDITTLEQAETMRRDFVANVSHEIRTPLTVLSGFIETLKTLPLQESERARYLDLMAQQSHRMQTLVNDLLTLSRIEGSPRPDATGWVGSDALMVQCEQEARALSRLLAPAGHRLAFDGGRPCELAGAHNELLSAMSNLVSNAVRYTPPGGLVKVSWTLQDDGCGRFEVQDSGPGIAQEHIPRLTERFYRVDRSRSRETGGTGLGLAIVKHVVQRHGAELQIESQPGHGSRFAIVFPATRVRQIPA